MCCCCCCCANHATVGMQILKQSLKLIRAEGSHFATECSACFVLRLGFFAQHAGHPLTVHLRLRLRPWSSVSPPLRVAHISLIMLTFFPGKGARVCSPNSITNFQLVFVSEMYINIDTYIFGICIHTYICLQHSNSYSGQCPQHEVLSNCH